MFCSRSTLKHRAIHILNVMILQKGVGVNILYFYSILLYFNNQNDVHHFLFSLCFLLQHNYNVFQIACLKLITFSAWKLLYLPGLDKYLHFGLRTCVRMNLGVRMYSGTLLFNGFPLFNLLRMYILYQSHIFDKIFLKDIHDFKINFIIICHCYYISFVNIWCKYFIV